MTSVKLHAMKCDLKICISRPEVLKFLITKRFNFDGFYYFRPDNIGAPTKEHSEKMLEIVHSTAAHDS